MATNTPAPAPLESERIHRRQSFRQITLPLIGGFLFLALALGLPVAFLMLPNTAEVATLSNLMVILFMLLPNFLCLMGFYLLLAYLIFGLGTFNKFSARRLRQLNRLSVNISERTTNITTTIDRRTLDARVRIAGIESAMDRAFQPDTTPADNESDADTETESEDTP